MKLVVEKMQKLRRLVRSWDLLCQEPVEAASRAAARRKREVAAQAAEAGARIHLGEVVDRMDWAGFEDHTD